MSKQKKTMPKAADVKKYISKYQSERRFPPTLREMSDHFGVSIPTIRSRLDELQAAGELTRDNGWRTIFLTGEFRKNMIYLLDIFSKEGRMKAFSTREKMMAWIDKNQGIVVDVRIIEIDSDD